MVNRSFNRMVESLHQLERDRAILLAGISHDLRTPLTRLRLDLEMSGLADDVRNAMIEDLNQLDLIVRQFLDYARPVAARPAQPVDLSALGDDAMARVRLDALPDCRSRTDIEPGVYALADATDLGRALDNLLSNAIRYGRDAAGRLDVLLTIRREGQDAVIALADHGPGIEQEQKERLLRPFERGDASRSGTGGAGLGLAIVERIARAHHGRLTLKPNLPTGLIAELRIPAASDARVPSTA